MKDENDSNEAKHYAYYDYKFKTINFEHLI